MDNEGGGTDPSMTNKYSLVGAKQYIPKVPPCLHKFWDLLPQKARSVMKSTPELLSAVLRSLLWGVWVYCTLLVCCAHCTVYIDNLYTPQIVPHSADRSLSFLLLLSRAKGPELITKGDFYQGIYSLVGARRKTLQNIIANCFLQMLSQSETGNFVTLLL